MDAWPWLYEDNIVNDTFDDIFMSKGRSKTLNHRNFIDIWARKSIEETQNVGNLIGYDPAILNFRWHFWLNVY